MLKDFNKFLINSIIFSDEPINTINNYNINNIFFDKILYLLDEFVITYNNMQMIDDYMSQNIYDVVNYIKFNYNYNNSSEKNVKYNFYNNIITKLNNALKINNEIFYISQIIDRGMFVDYNEPILPEKLKEEIRYSICFDKDFYEMLSKTDYQTKQLDYSKLVMNKFFLYSVHYFLLECPDILENNNLLKQVLINNLKETRKIFLNKNDTNIKKYSKNLLNNIRW